MPCSGRAALPPGSSSCCALHKKMCGRLLLFACKSCILGGRKLHKRNRGMNMLTLRGIITLVILAVLFALAVVWISRQGGWKGEGCSGNCASCHSHCEDPDTKKK